MGAWRQVLVTTLALSCAPAAGPAPAGTVVGSPDERSPGLELAQSGTLRQEEISVRMRAGALRIEVTPLVDWVLEAAAPDTQRRLRSIMESHSEDLPLGQRDLTLLLVSFSSAEPDAEFRPEDLHVVARGLRERPHVIRPVTPGWGSGRLAQQSTATAVYGFPGSLDLSRDMTIEYGNFSDRSWSVLVTRIEAERGRIPGAGRRLEK